MSEAHRKVTRAAGVNSAATSLSRVLGLIRDMTLSYFFGTTAVNSSFLFAFSIPNLLRKLFGEGAMASAFIPLFAEKLHTDGRDEAYDVANITLTLLAALLATIAAVIAAVCLFFAVFVVDDVNAKLTFYLTALMIPYCILICLTALCGAMLNTFGHFAKPALAPVLLNVAMIGATWLGAWVVGQPMERHIYAVAIGVLVGGAAQLALQLPELHRRGFRFKAAWSLSHPFVKRISFIMAPAILGVGVTQINVMVDRFLARIVNERGVTVLFYADRLVELPLGVFGVALAVAVLPTISFCAAKKDDRGFVTALAFSLRQVCFIIVPAAVGLMLLADPIIRLLFQRGEFSAESTMYTMRALRLYAPGLMGFALLKIIVPAFYARKDTKTPVRVGVCVLVLNVALNLILMQFMAERGLALSTTICAYVNVSILLILLRRKLGPLGMKRVVASILRITVTAVIMGWVVWGMLNWMRRLFSDDALTGQLVHVAVPVAAGLVVYTVIAFFSGQPELKELLSAYLRKKR